MARVLVTGMPGAGKSTVLAELSARGIRVVDSDDAGWSVEVDDTDGLGREQLWREDRIAALLDEVEDEPFVVSGCVSNQGMFYDRLEVVVLLTAPLDVLLERVGRRMTKDFGKSPADRARISLDYEAVEPLLRATSGLVLDATRPVRELADEIEDLARG